MVADGIALVTGCSGFLGKHVVGQLSAEGWETIGVGRRPFENVQLPGLQEYREISLPSEALRELLERLQPDAIFHCAGSASVDQSISSPLADFQENTVVVADLLDAMRRVGSKAKFVFVSSAAVYGSPETLPTDEECSNRPVSPYGYHKLQGEMLCRQYAQIHGLRTVVARVFSAYGAGLRRQVVWDVCRKALLDEAVLLKGSGLESRDFIHVQDVAVALSVLARSGLESGQTVNVASGVELSIAQLANWIVECLAPGKEVRFSGATHEGNPANWRADVRRLRELGFSPSVNLQTGIQGVARWVRDEQEL